MNNAAEPKIPITCPKCSTSFSAPLPSPEIINAKRVTVVTATREKPVTCISCGQGFVIIAASAQVSWVAQPIDDSILEELRGSRVVPALVLPHARPH